MLKIFLQPWPKSDAQRWELPLEDFWNHNILYFLYNKPQNLTFYHFGLLQIVQKRRQEV